MPSGYETFTAAQSIEETENKVIYFSYGRPGNFRHCKLSIRKSKYLYLKSSRDDEFYVDLSTIKGAGIGPYSMTFKEATEVLSSPEKSSKIKGAVTRVH